MNNFVKSFFFYTTIFLFIPNLLSIALANYIDVYRPIFFVDYCLAAIPIILLKNKLSCFLSAFIIILFILLDNTLLILSKFNFDIDKILGFVKVEGVNFNDLKNLIFNFVSNDNFLFFITVAFLMVSSLIFIFMPKILRLNINLKLYFVLIIYLILLSPKYLFYQDYRIYKLADTFFNLGTFFREEANYDRIYDPNFKLNNIDVNSASEVVFAKIKNKELNNKKIFLIIVESFGIFEDKAAQNIIYTSLKNQYLKDLYNIKTSEIAFKGNTVESEFRELCQAKLNNGRMPSKENFSVILSGCLPFQLKNLGYDIKLMHNADGKFYDRIGWYNLFNPDSVYFAKNLEENFNLQSNCGTSYKGACEDEIFRKFITPLFDNDKKQFLYFMTVEGHMPIDRKRKASESFLELCNKTKTLSGKKNKDLCSYSELHYNIVKYTSELALKMKDRNAIFIIVGDHQPPILNKYKNYYKKNTVPYIILERI